ncbi:hypothetical protein LJR161_004463 [Variovorax paradoxus]|uniref:Meckel syndrome type 1 protein n=1 Tax=Variovorax paradoxus TaxID=34073 RepID=A0AAW8EJZ8_VARPD|nr:hypothetical protein [Variovorax paradoxus]MDP9973215.1 hypothetical protein [Variovorax paradoxus]
MNTGSGTPGFDDGGEDAALRDPALRRALDHAPDSDELPDPRTRDAIRKMAHNLAPVPAAAPAAEDEGAAPWWRRLFGGGGGSHARMPWNAAFATVLLATFVTVLWHREPVPDARLDGKAGVASAPATAQEAAPSAAAVPAPATAPAPASAPPPAPAQAQPQPQAEAARDTVSEESMRSREIAVRRSAPPPSGKQAAAPAPEPQASQVAPEPPPLPASLPAPAPPAAVPPAPASPAAAIAPPLPPAPMATREAAGGGVSASSPALSAPQRSPSADAASGMLRSAPAPRTAVMAGKAAASPAEGAFSALDQWTSLNATRAGQSVRHARGDTEGLAALVNTLARSATAPGAEPAAPVEARLELYRGGALLAVLEIAGDQVRWTPQGTAAGASVGTPPAQALAELKALLAR